MWLGIKDRDGIGTSPFRTFEFRFRETQAALSLAKPAINYRFAEIFF
jgi:hypothetical protein